MHRQVILAGIDWGRVGLLLLSMIVLVHVFSKSRHSTFMALAMKMGEEISMAERQSCGGGDGELFHESKYEQQSLAW